MWPRAQGRLGFRMMALLSVAYLSLQKAGRSEERSELVSNEEDQNEKKARQNSRSERRRLQAQLRERAQVELEHVRAARDQQNNVDIFPYKAREGDSSPNSSSSRSKPRKLPFAGSTDVARAGGLTTSSASFSDGCDESAECPEMHGTPLQATQEREEIVLESSLTVTPQQESIPCIVPELAATERLCNAALPPGREVFDSRIATHVASEEDTCALLVQERKMSISRVPVLMAREADVLEARAKSVRAPAAQGRSFAEIIKQLLSSRIISQRTAAALLAPVENCGGVEERSPGAAECEGRGQASSEEVRSSFPRALSATEVVKKLSESILRYHPMFRTVRSILRSGPADESSSSSSSDDDGTNVPVYRTLSVQRRSCMRRRGPLRFIRRTLSRVDWATNADEAVYIEYVAPAFSLLPPEAVEVRSPPPDAPPKQIKLASEEEAATRAAAAAKAAAEGDPEREAAAAAAAADAAALATEARQEGAEVAAAEAEATAEKEARALAQLAAAAAAVEEAEIQTLAAKARAGRLSREELELWQRRREGG